MSLNPEMRSDLRSPQVAVTAKTFVQAEQEIALRQEILQDISQDNLKNLMEEAINPLASRYQTRQKSLSDQSSRIRKAYGAEKGRLSLPIQKIKDSAEKFEKRNSEFRAKMLMLLREQIKEGDAKEDILKKVRDFYPDPTLTDEVLDFLKETTLGELQETVEQAKQEHNEQHGREIRAGKNIAEEVLKYTEKGLGAPTSLRDLYRDITGNPREPGILFNELSDRFPFAEMRKVIAFLFHSLGADLKSSGPSIPPGLLHNLLTEVRSLQAILGVYNFFKGRMKLMQSLFSRNGIPMPKQLTFELMAKQFMTLVGERYPTADKVLQSAVRLGIEKWILAKIIAFSTLRDAIREVALNRIYKTVQHRDELYKAIIEALENLEEELEALEDEEERQRRRQEADDEDQLNQDNTDGNENKKGPSNIIKSM